jgi:Ser/Thr protein kinase RdoA (MazF antagonist)
VSAVKSDTLGRARGVSVEIDAARRAADRLLGAPEIAPGALPRRVVHNDCKLNNLLLDDQTGEPLCVVDLDTVMPGTVLFDFGELARTGACPAAEDERDLARVVLDPELFRALASGFVAGARGLLTAEEIRALPLAGPLMALENGVRFLTDHLDGDRYFRSRARGTTSTVRARSCALADEMLAAGVAMRTVFADLA